VQVFVFEYLTSGGTIQAPDAHGKTDSLLCEGLAMMRALATDLAALTDVEVLMQVDSRLQDAAPAECDVHYASSASEEIETFCSLASIADWTIVIAPEIDNMLFQRCQVVEEIGGRLLGPSSETVAILADKLTTARRLEDGGVRTPQTQQLDDVLASHGSSHLPAVVKPRFGAGSQDVQLVKNLSDFADQGRNDWLVQEYCRGQAVSVAGLFGPSQIALMPAVTQQISDDGLFRYLGGRHPVTVEQEARAHRIVRNAIDILPELSGFVGFDLVLGDHDNEDGDVVIEINPRLTTSYIGLRKISQRNLAVTMIDVASGNPVELSFSREPIEFFPDGSVRNISRVDISQ
jgi:predicted ATP-grasp superfamily ATP-dependent carboligase